MILEFSEAMNRSSLEIGGITLQDNSTATVSHTLRSFSSTDVDGTTFTLTLSSTDTDVLKRSIICVTLSNCFVSISGVAMADMSDLPVVAIGDGSAKQAASLNADAAGPIFDASDNLDFNDATLTLSFNEPVEPASV